MQVLSGVMSGGGGGGRGGRGGGGGAQEGRLAKALVDTKLAQSASMGFQLLHDPGLVQVTATLSQDQQLDAARDAVYEAIDDVVKNPPTEAEVERVKTQMLRGLENNLSNAQAIATGALNTAIAQGDWRLMFLQHDRLKAVTPADLVRVAKTYFKPSNRTVGYYIPDAAPERTVITPAPDLYSTLRNYSSSVSVARGESFDPSIPNIDERVVRSKLANGMKVAVLSKKTANNIVTATIDLRFGDQTTLAGQREAASFAGGLLMAGTKSHTRQQLAEEMRKLNAQINVSGGGGGGGGRGGGRGGGGGGGMASASASISAPAENFQAALKLAAEILREPSYPQDEFDRIKTQRLRALELTPTEPTQLAAERLSRHLSPFAKGDPLYAPTPQEQIPELQKVTLDQARQVPRAVLRRQLRRLRGRRSRERGRDPEGRERAVRHVDDHEGLQAARHPASRRWRRSTRRSRRRTRRTRSSWPGRGSSSRRTIPTTRRSWWRATCSASRSRHASPIASAIARA